MNAFYLTIETEDDLTPGDISAELLKVRQRVLGCEVQGDIFNYNNENIGEWSIEKVDDEPA